jgi:two-component system C4-dicarboxylate transport sensor histidine kinase DctB
MQNILVNAIQAPEDSGRGIVEVSVLAGPRAVTVHVDDSGSGGDPQDRQRLFEPGYSRRPGGTGLGLFLSARVADAQGGTLEYGQSPLGSARFSMTLPRTETA